MSDFPPFDEWLLADDSIFASRNLDAYADLEGQDCFTHEAIDHLDKIAAAATQLKLALPAMDERARVRIEVADYIERVVWQVCTEHTIACLPERLRHARQNFSYGVRPRDGKTIIRWDVKAGLPLLCPDDAREEAMRLQRRLVPALMAELARGRSLHTAVLTIPNCAPGELHKTMRKLQRRFVALMRACKRKNRPFPIISAVTIMESPLGWRRDWHPHLNVILVCDGFLDYGKLREWWHWDAHFSRLRGSETQLRAALREIVKYSVRSVPEKSYEKAQVHARAKADSRRNTGGRAHHSRGGQVGAGLAEAQARDPPSHGGELREEADRGIAPALTEWTALEFLEWWRAHRKFRRTRTYGGLYGLDDPEPEDMDGFIMCTAARFDGAHFVARTPLLESIPGDKSTTPDPVKRWEKFFRPPKGSSWLLDNGPRLIHEAREQAE